MTACCDVIAMSSATHVTCRHVVITVTSASKKMAKARVNFDVPSFIKLIYENPLLWDSRRDDYKLAENKPLVWDKLAAEVKSDRGK